MLYYLLYEKLFPYVSPFRVFRFVTFRAAFASLTALFLCIALGPWLINRLREFQIGQQIREEGPKSHQKKAGTPTMGGVLIVISIIVPTLLWADLRYVYVWVALFGLVSFAAIGFIDDRAKVLRKRNLGLTSGQKFRLQLWVALIITAVLVVLSRYDNYSTSMNVPFFKTFQPDLLIHSLMHSSYTYPFAFLFFFLFVVFVVVGASNAVNLTDGLDGLAIGLMVIASAALTVLAYMGGHREFAQYLQLARNPRTAELTIFCGSMVGSSLGFLWYNAHPADIFMGDVGSLSLGGAMGVVAILIKQEVLLLFIGGVFVLELLSVVLQVGSFKLRGKRIFKMAPIHHHFEALGWTESKIIVRFWIAGLVLALLALSTLKLR
ncbi:MAG TPA: phospho-N-acetylmuramoyl-pentapeptide-transferase [Solibacterales bacterium]|nr:phospho-N-acetylmuramoyl-pentapeptide-transferase [Bryobacterales bacterium]